MDFDTALNEKLEMGDLFVVDKLRFKVLVTPADPIDFDKYCDNFNMETFTDRSAIQFSTDNRFDVRALRIENGVIKWEYPDLLPL